MRHGQEVPFVCFRARALAQCALTLLCVSEGKVEFVEAQHTGTLTALGRIHCHLNEDESNANRREKTLELTLFFRE